MNDLTKEELNNIIEVLEWLMHPEDDIWEGEHWTKEELLSSYKYSYSDNMGWHGEAKLLLNYDKETIIEILETL